MNIFFISNEFYGFFVIFLDVVIVLSIFSGIFIIISKNPIISVLHLIALFSCISCYLIFLGINFIGLSYLLVYVGAVSILFLFILMLINVRISELFNSSNKSIPLAIFVIISFIYTVYPILPYKGNIFNTSFLENNKVYYVTSPLWDGNLSESSHITSIGNIMYTNFSIWLILTSIILLLAMVGAILITIKPKDIS